MIAFVSYTSSSTEPLSCAGICGKLYCAIEALFDCLVWRHCQSVNPSIGHIIRLHCCKYVTSEICIETRAILTRVTTLSIRQPTTVCCCIVYIYRCVSFHSCQILSCSRTGFIVSAHKLTNITLLTLVQATLCSSKGSR